MVHANLFLVTFKGRFSEEIFVRVCVQSEARRRKLADRQEVHFHTILPSAPPLMDCNPKDPLM